MPRGAIKPARLPRRSRELLRHSNRPARALNSSREILCRPMSAILTPALVLSRGVKPTKAVLRDHFDPLFPDFNTDYPDQLRADEFLNEFEAYSRARKKNESPEFQLP